MKTHKQLIVTIFFILFVGFSTHAQTIKVGLGNELRKEPPLSMLTKITYNLEFLDPNMRTSIDFIFLPELRGNLDIHYSFGNDQGVKPYGLGGVSFAVDAGFNMGAGVDIPITEDLGGFSEVKYIFKYNPNLSFKLGLLYTL
mgnify:CR=1 FL=1